MRLSTARLCLDCEEIHEDQVCPICASERFGFISRWVPSPEPRKAPTQSSPKVEIYKELLREERPNNSSRIRILRQSLIGLTAVGLFGWLWRTSQDASRHEKA
jgi:hypothetical protein